MQSCTTCGPQKKGSNFKRMLLPLNPHSDTGDRNQASISLKKTVVNRRALLIAVDCPRSWKQFEYLSVNDLLQGVTEWQTRMKRHACRPQENNTVQSSKETKPWVVWKHEVSQLSACHLAVSWSWECFHTSSERGHSGLPADVKIRTIDQLIGILWSYLGV